MQIILEEPPELEVQTWINVSDPLSLAVLRGKVVALFAFQMLCPACVEHCIPQARRVHALFSRRNVAVIGLHTVFEHHSAMTEMALRAFLYEYRIAFPVGIDMPSGKRGNPIPKTMEAYQMGGTPSIILIDHKGRLRKHKMGYEEDLILGSELTSLIHEAEEV